MTTFQCVDTPHNTFYAVNNIKLSPLGAVRSVNLRLIK